MVHLRIVAPGGSRRAGARAPLRLVRRHERGAPPRRSPTSPKGDLILCDVAREEASQIIGDLKDLDVPSVGSIAVELIDSSISKVAAAAERAAPGLPSDAVVWEEVEARTSEQTELSVSFLAFMVAAMQIAAVGIILDQPILIVGAMVVGPEFGPLAAICVALVRRQGSLAQPLADGTGRRLSDRDRPARCSRRSR